MSDGFEARHAKKAAALEKKPSAKKSALLFPADTVKLVRVPRTFRVKHSSMEALPVMWLV